MQGGYFRIDIALMADAFTKAIQRVSESIREFGRFVMGIDLASGPDQTALMRQPPSCTMEGLTPAQPAAAHEAETANNQPDSGPIYWFIADVWEVLTPVPVTVVKDNGSLITAKWQVTEDHAEEYEEIRRNQLYATEAEAWRVINEGR